MSKGSSFIAHIKTDKNNKKDISNTHSLRSHIDGVLQIAQSFDSYKNFDKHITLAALIHDIGKYQDEFQDYIVDDNGRRGSVVHAKYGAIVASQKYKSREVSFAVASHHGGMRNNSDWKVAHASSIDDKDKPILLEILKLWNKEISNIEGMNQFLLILSQISIRIASQRTQIVFFSWVLFPNAGFWRLLERFGVNRPVHGEEVEL